jgi:hypothetical protein
MRRGGWDLVSETRVDGVDHGKSPPSCLEEPVGQPLTVAARYWGRGRCGDVALIFLALTVQF